MSKNDLLIRQLCEDVADLKRRVAAMPVVVSPYTEQNMYLIIDQGNTLDSGQPGIKHLTTLLTSIPVYDPNVNTSFVDGIGRGRVVKNGQLMEGYVLVCNDVRSLWAATLVRDDTVAVSALISVGGTQAYLPI